MITIDNKLCAYGPVGGATGYDEVTREFVKQFVMSGIRLKLMEFANWSNSKIKISDFYQRLKNAVIKPEIILNICLPEQIELNEHLINVNYTMLEVDRVPELWARIADHLDLTIVPSNACKEAWIKSGVSSSKVINIPLGVDLDKYNKDVIPLEYNEILKYNTRIIVLQEVSDRKNIFNLLECWMCSATKINDMCLILKIADFSSSRYEDVIKFIEMYKKKYKIRKIAPIFLFPKILDDDDLSRFLALGTHYLSMSRGEGFDLTAIKMLAMGKSLIVPKHTGYLEYANNDNSYLIESVPAKAKMGGIINRLYLNSNWYEPNKEQLIDILKNIDSYKPKSDYEIVRKDLQKFSWSNISKKMINALEGVYHPVKKIVYQKGNFSVCLVCKTMNTKCGIAEYTKHLYTNLRKYNKLALMAVGGPSYYYLPIIDSNSLNVVHIQYEYQFHSPIRLKNLLMNLRNRGIKSIVTQHTFSPSAIEYNDVLCEYADRVVVPSELVYKKYRNYGANNLSIINAGCNYIDEEVLKRIEPSGKMDNKFVIGFFGFSYFHKGLHKLIEAFSKLSKNYNNLFLFILSNKPAGDQQNYYEYCKDLISLYGIKDYLWNDSYVTELDILKILSNCNLIVLPYSEYGGYGTSAAIRTCMSVNKPILVSDVSWFSDVPENVVIKYKDNNLESAISHLLHGYDFNVYLSNMKEYVYNNRWENCAKKHIELYDDLIGIKI